MKLVLSCEHGGHRIPARYRGLFEGSDALLRSHLGWDPGALELAQQMSRAFDAPLVASRTTRLLIDLNRTRHHPGLFSRWSSTLSEEQRAELLERHWQTHRDALRQHLSEVQRGPTLHLSVHSFTPDWKGRTRSVDVGVLYDPSRTREAQLASVWIDALRQREPSLRVHRNRPYRGTSDGLTTELRCSLPARLYLGLELEVSQAFPLGEASRWRSLRRSLIQSLRSSLRSQASRS